ncbi:hypothetical protein [Sphaerisporangium sp. TRM90804]|uniref:hypothetical protein n=1 Tax=Sphaerisporangium sp. TRM90804 TaxID=3031113 RepID=UPI00244BC879|nr:hypothetical protein [Sphaerisporangium sp. TRM90804]MDH2426738.1 hypothetical protein [Sphaerisporangium sp. TRM90804]
MRRHLSALAALALAGSLAGASLAVPAAAASAPAASHALTAPQSPLKFKVQYPKAVKKGGTITYTIKSTNVGEWPTDLAALLAKLPKGASKIRVVGKPSTAFCEASGRDLFCLFDTIKPNRSATVKVRVWLKKSTKGNAYAEFGTVSIDVPSGVDVTNEEELDKLDLQDDVKYAKVKTRILR